MQVARKHATSARVSWRLRLTYFVKFKLQKNEKITGKSVKLRLFFIFFRFFYEKLSFFHFFCENVKLARFARPKFLDNYLVWIQLKGVSNPPSYIFYLSRNGLFCQDAFVGGVYNTDLPNFISPIKFRDWQPFQNLLWERFPTPIFLFFKGFPTLISPYLPLKVTFSARNPIQRSP